MQQSQKQSQKEQSENDNYFCILFNELKATLAGKLTSFLYLLRYYPVVSVEFIPIRDDLKQKHKVTCIWNIIIVTTRI